jgi:uncharacterized HAD superfamily protein
MNIYVDMDDVLCETAAALCDIARREFNRHVNYSDVCEFDLQKTFSLSDAEMDRFRIISHQHETLISYPETPDAVAGVKSLLRKGHSIDIVTGRPASAHLGTEAWLRSVGLGDVAVTYVDKYNRADAFECGADDPPTVPFDELERRVYDVVIDDSPVALNRLASWHEALVLVFDRPWNRKFDLARNMRRISGWADVFKYIKEA